MVSRFHQFASTARGKEIAAGGLTSGTAFSIFCLSFMAMAV
jgi:hypothetical protein